MINPIPKLQPKAKKAPPKKKEGMINPTLQGILVDTHIRGKGSKFVDFDDTCDMLMIPPNSYTKKDLPEQDSKKQSFDTKKALLPLAIGTIAAAVGMVALSFVVKKSYKTSLDNRIEKLPDLARNMNIRQEPQFATYRMLRDPSPGNILGATAVFLFSGLTIAAKNFVDGTKEIWTKKQEADIDRDLQENLIEVETRSFSGKLGVINELLGENIQHFKDILNPSKEEVFKPFLTFKGNVEPEVSTKELKDKEKKSVTPVVLGALGVVGALALSGAVVISNLRKNSKNLNDYFNKFKQIAKESPEKLFVDADKMMYGTAGKTQYYCYIDEDRGHLYNWIINPENKFTKYVFASFSAVSAVGYVFKQGLDAIKSVAVSRENSKTELNLKKRLVEVEIANFRAKKNAAISPLIDNFNYRAMRAKSQDELKGLAENILFEIKGGPPYVYS